MDGRMFRARIKRDVLKWLQERTGNWQAFFFYPTDFSLPVSPIPEGKRLRVQFDIEDDPDDAPNKAAMAGEVLTLPEVKRGEVMDLTKPNPDCENCDGEGSGIYWPDGPCGACWPTPCEHDYCASGNHEWAEHYYGQACKKCGMFVPDGHGPWMPADHPPTESEV